MRRYNMSNDHQKMASMIREAERMQAQTSFLSKQRQALLTRPGAAE